MNIWPNWELPTTEGSMLWFLEQGQWNFLKGNLGVRTFGSRRESYRRPRLLCLLGLEPSLERLEERE